MGRIERYGLVAMRREPSRDDLDVDRPRSDRAGSLARVEELVLQDALDAPQAAAARTDRNGVEELALSDQPSPQHPRVLRGLQDQHRLEARRATVAGVDLPLHVALG